jgi:hypothetical protein
MALDRPPRRRPVRRRACAVEDPAALRLELASLVFAEVNIYGYLLTSAEFKRWLER